jgi:hypothetical protein
MKLSAGFTLNCTPCTFSLVLTLRNVPTRGSEHDVQMYSYIASCHSVVPTFTGNLRVREVETRRRYSRVLYREWKLCWVEKGEVMVKSQHEDMRRSGGIAPYIFNLDTNWE